VFQNSSVLAKDSYWHLLEKDGTGKIILHRLGLRTRKRTPKRLVACHWVRCQWRNTY
jgi:hypothetical protein